MKKKREGEKKGGRVKMLCDTLVITTTCYPLSIIIIIYYYSWEEKR